MHHSSRFVISLTFLAASASAGAAADGARVTGVTNIGPGLVILAIAVGLLLTLILRPTVAAFSNALAEGIGRRRMSRLLRKSSTNVLHHFILPGAYGGLTRIDHAVLLAGRIVCIQTRHFSGDVSGGRDDPQWTHRSGGRKRRFLNPQIQNEGRAAALRKVAPDTPVSNLVVFTGKVKFSAGKDKNVIHLSELKSFLDKLECSGSKASDMQTLWLTVRSAALTDQASHKDFDAQLSFG